MRFETRDPFQEKIRREDSFQTDWDRYAHMEYTRLSQEEEDGAAYTVRYQIEIYSTVCLCIALLTWIVVLCSVYVFVCVGIGVFYGCG